jgi:hypothetical protein
MTPDHVNGLFEGVGSIMLWLNVRQLVKDKILKGVHYGPVVFWTAWGFWNLYYYPALHQIWSLIGGIDVVLANSVWLLLLWHYREKT